MLIDNSVILAWVPVPGVTWHSVNEPTPSAVAHPTWPTSTGDCPGVSWGGSATGESRPPPWGPTTAPDNGPRTIDRPTRESPERLVPIGMLIDNLV